MLKHKDTLRYTSTRERNFRPEAQKPFVMRTHNHLLGSFEGCDGLKTGYYREAGFSIAATAQRNGLRAIAVVMGSPKKEVRDAKAKELLSLGLSRLAEKQSPAASAPATNAHAAATAPAAKR